jgi:large subunit ribosomal protein L18e
MSRTVDYEDPSRLGLIQELKASAKKEDAEIWKTLAAELSRPRQNRREVNMWKLSKYTAAGETVVVPGKVLGDGVLEHKINIAAYKFSDAAKKKIEQSGGKMMSIAELVKKNPKGSNIKLIA